MLVRETNDADGLSVLEIGREFLVLPPPVVLDDPGCGVHDVSGRTEVLPERNHRRPGVVLLEVENVPDVRTPPGIDRLIGVADDEDVPVTAGDRIRDHELRMIRVLILVDQHVAESFLQRAANTTVLLENSG